jgi:hypothetical protein
MGRILALLFAAVLLAGCATPPAEEKPAHRSGVSTIPWNRPAKWEGPGTLGSQMGAMQGM